MHTFLYILLCLPIYLTIYVSICLSTSQGVYESTHRLLLEGTHTLESDKSRFETQLTHSINI